MNETMKNTLAFILLATTIAFLACVDMTSDFTPVENQVEYRYSSKQTEVCRQPIADSRIYNTSLVR